MGTEAEPREADGAVGLESERDRQGVLSSIQTEAERPAGIVIRVRHWPLSEHVSTLSLSAYVRERFDLRCGTSPNCNTLSSIFLFLASPARNRQPMARSPRARPHCHRLVLPRDSKIRGVSIFVPGDHQDGKIDGPDCAGLHGLAFDRSPTRVKLPCPMILR